MSYRPLPSVPPHAFYVHENSNIGVIILYECHRSHFYRYVKVVRASISFLAKLLPPFFVNWNNCKMASMQIWVCIVCLLDMIDITKYYVHDVFSGSVAA